MEQIDEVDSSGKVIATHPRDYLKKRIFMHNVSLIIPMAPYGKLVLAKRAANKHPYPGVWCCAVGGKASSGESSEDAAVREMKEEIGKSYPLRKVCSFIYDKEDYKGIFTVFTTTVPIAQEELKLDPEEIETTKAFTVEELKAIIAREPESFAPTFLAAMKEFTAHIGVK